MSPALASTPPLTNSNIRELIRKVKTGDYEAREQVLLAFLPMAHNKAVRYQGYGVPYDDLYQEACYGILLAMEHYDPDRKETFGTFATHYVDKCIRDNALTKQNSFLPSCYNRDFYYEIKSFISSFQEIQSTLGRYPSELEISDYLDISILRVRRLKQASIAFLAPSLDADSAFLEGYPGSPIYRPVEDEVLRLVDPLDIFDKTPDLTPREREVLERRFGFTDSGEPQTWPEICASMGLCKFSLHEAFTSAIAKYRNAIGLD